jgi:hypothetical protein
MAAELKWGPAIEILDLEDPCWKNGQIFSAGLHPLCEVKRGFVDRRKNVHMK